MTDRMLRYRVRRLIDGRRRTLAEVARHLGVSRSRIYDVFPEVRFRFSARPAISAPPISLALQAFASHFGAFTELETDRTTPTAPPSPLAHSTTP